MIYVGLPLGSTYGWGVLGKQVVLEMAQLADIRLLVPPPGLSALRSEIDEIDWHRLRQLTPGPEDHRYMEANPGRMPGPVIQSCVNLIPRFPQITPPYHVGFAVFEDNVLQPEVVQQAKASFRHLATGSTYCADVLRQHGFTNVSAVLHGVDTIDFHPRHEPRPFLRDKFVVFSGGKFELRKGQDIVIRAYKVLQDRHKDVFLINSWCNYLPSTRDTMQLSRLICYEPPLDDDYVAWMNSLLATNGLDLDRVLTVGPRYNRLMDSVYHATDVGLFPNRVEGGTNMVLMEYMACGKPVIAAYNSGHKDVLRKECAVLIERFETVTILEAPPKPNVEWSEPDLEETIEKLEWAYQNRDKLCELGRQAAEDMKQFTWKRVAQGLLDCIPIKS